MSDNLADFLNDNAGVVTGAAGYAVHRNITATNRNLSSLRGDLRKLQAQLVQEKQKEAKERLNRDMLFQIGLQVEAVKQREPSADTLLALQKIHEDFKQLKFTSASFNTLEDKTFLNAVSSTLEQCLRTTRESLSDETKEQITEITEWNQFAEMAEAIAIADEKIPYARRILQKRLNDLHESERPSLLDNKILLWLFAGSLIPGVLLLLSGHGGFLLTAVVLLLVAVGAAITMFVDFDKKRKQHQTNGPKTPDNAVFLSKTASDYLQKHIRDLESVRSEFCTSLASLKRVPRETVAFITSDSIGTDEKLAYLPEAKRYLNQLRDHLDVAIENLPTIKRDEGEHLNYRANSERWWKESSKDS